jgi:hypothetical protein
VDEQTTAFQIVTTIVPFYENESLHMPAVVLNTIVVLGFVKIL